MKREAKATTIWNKYCRASRTYGIFELKQTTTDVFYLSNFEEHQLSSLLAVEQNGLVWKLSDADMREKPADVLSIPPLLAYVVIKFKTKFCMIPARKIVLAKASGHKYITEEQAEKLSTKVINLS